MKIIIISDSHGNHDNVEYVFNNHRFDYLFYLGDGITDLGNHINEPNVYYVKGNCDFFYRAEYELILTIENKKFFITHGHNYGVKFTLNSLLKEAKKHKADFVLFGHSHTSLVKTMDDIVFINPGAVSRVRGGNNTFAILTLENNDYNVQIINI